MKKLYPFFSILGACGFLASLYLYLLTFWNYNAKDSMLYFTIEILMFVVWAAAIFKLVKDPEVRALKEDKPNNPFAFLKVVFKDTPIWMQFIAAASLILGSVGFASIMFTKEGLADIINGKKVLHSHGTVIKELSNQEYKHALAIESRQFLGHYLMFYAIGTAILWEKKNN